MNTSEKTAPSALGTTTSARQQPALYVPHGGGPWPFTNEPLFGAPDTWQRMSAYFTGLASHLPEKPAAILVISAHWEETLPTVMTHATPPMLYDYSGFPKETYEVQWPAPGAPPLAHEVTELFASAGFRSGEDAQRGFDHGTFVPLKLAFPEADVPTFQLSLKRGLSPLEHLQMGRLIAPLRQRGVAIIGSGMSYHNMRTFMQNARSGATGASDDSKAFDDWLAESMALEPSERERRLIEWEQAPAARSSHPREEHLLPLMVIAGAGAEDPATLPYRDVIMGTRVSAVHFG